MHRSGHFSDTHQTEKGAREYRTRGGVEWGSLFSDNVTWHTLLILAEWTACPAICLGHPHSPGSASQPSSPNPRSSLHSLPVLTDNGPALSVSPHTIQPTCSKEERMEGGDRRVVENNALSGERPAQVNIHYKRPSSRLCIWAWRCRPCCCIFRHLLPLFKARTRALLRVARQVCGRGAMSRGRVCVHKRVCVCVWKLCFNDICCSLSFLIRMIYDTVWVSISTTFEVN